VQWGTFSSGGGRLARAGTGLLSPTASNAPTRKDTHSAAWNVPLVAGYFRDGNQGQLSAQTECQRTGEVHPDAQDWPHLRG